MATGNGRMRKSMANQDNAKRRSSRNLIMQGAVMMLVESPKAKREKQGTGGLCGNEKSRESHASCTTPPLQGRSKKSWKSGLRSEKESSTTKKKHKNKEPKSASYESEIVKDYENELVAEWPANLQSCDKTALGKT